MPDYILMPLLRNVPEGREGWVETTCPECGTACWSRPAAEAEARAAFGDLELKSVCTACGLHLARPERHRDAGCG